MNIEVQEAKDANGSAIRIGDYVKSLNRAIGRITALYPVAPDRTLADIEWITEHYGSHWVDSLVKTEIEDLI